ncbi:hypothetical protein GOARA_063_00790 [Gordonia araii NBRC 100433]|uniref:Low molecular weight antigen MTB12-like C-terminal domain-containing protein n=1 Tax=Gordonia araii NBRC 100433 TaxID=1073574 RepID=G7H4V5_9ACTN|nr:hypothetical protein [Gordonia araii]NNG97980.1 hypothetical protein [Gordonia araii NBRC 100433]GAB10880.1 hypothetical protein GOARA_063_00790 [Gordonia araii NBRC 100433]
MSKFARAAFGALFAVVVATGLATPAAQADVSVRNGKAADLSVRAERPSSGQLERQFAAFWNPNVPLGPKLAVTYRGNTPAVRKALGNVMSMSRTYDFFSVQGRFGAPSVSGSRMSATGSGVMAGFPATSVRYHWIREGGLWKYDWKAICSEMKCSGNPNFGY